MSSCSAAKPAEKPQQSSASAAPSASTATTPSATPESKPSVLSIGAVYKAPTLGVTCKLPKGWLFVDIAAVRVMAPDQQEKFLKDLGLSASELSSFPQEADGVAMKLPEELMFIVFKFPGSEGVKLDSEAMAAALKEPNQTLESEDTVSFAGAPAVRLVRVDPTDGANVTIALGGDNPAVAIIGDNKKKATTAQLKAISDEIIPTCVKA